MAAETSAIPNIHSAETHEEDEARDHLMLDPRPREELNRMVIEAMTTWTKKYWEGTTASLGCKKVGMDIEADISVNRSAASFAGTGLNDATAGGVCDPAISQPNTYLVPTAWGGISSGASCTVPDCP